MLDGRVTSESQNAFAKKHPDVDLMVVLIGFELSHSNEEQDEFLTAEGVYDLEEIYRHSGGCSLCQDVSGQCMRLKRVMREIDRERMNSAKEKGERYARKQK